MHPDIFQGACTSHVLGYSLKQIFKLEKKSGCIAIASDIMQAIWMKWVMVQLKFYQYAK